MSKKHRGRFKGDPVTYQLPSPAGGVQLETFVPWTLVKRGLKKQVITPLDAPQEFLSEATREREARSAAQDTAAPTASKSDRIIMVLDLIAICQRLSKYSHRNLPQFAPPYSMF